MKSSSSNNYYHTCKYCGANLDPGERCDCRDENVTALDNYQAVRNRGEKNNGEKLSKK